MTRPGDRLDVALDIYVQDDAYRVVLAGVSRPGQPTQPAPDGAIRNTVQTWLETPHSVRAFALWRTPDEPAVTRLPAVAGHCPLGCGETLQQRVTDGAIVCARPGCPRPDAVNTLLSDQETEHIVQFEADGFTIRHPLRERLDDALMQCELHSYCAGLPGPPPHDGSGRYRATFLGPRDWVFQPMDEEPAT